MATIDAWPGRSPGHRDRNRAGTEGGLLATRARRREVGRGLSALLGLLILLIGIPVVLAVLAGHPLPTRIPDWERVGRALVDGRDLPPEVAPKALALVGWLAWLAQVRAVVAEGAIWLTDRPATATRPGGPLRLVARPLVAATAALLVIGARPTPDVVAPTLQSVGALFPVTSPLRSENPPTGSRDPAPLENGAAHRVVAKDTLWDIAEARLGDPFRYPEVFDLNEGIPQDDGRSLKDPDTIYPGWVIHLPDDGSAAAPASGPSPAPAEPTAEPTPPTTAADTGPAHSGGHDQTPAAVSGDVAPADATTPGETPDDSGAGDGRPAPVGFPLPSGSYVAAELAAAAAAAFGLVALRRRRRRMPGPVGPGIQYEDDLRPANVSRLEALLNVHGPSDDATWVDPAAGQVRLAEANGRPIVVDLVALGALAIVGDAASGVARSLVASLALAPSGAAAAVVLAGEAAERLFPGGVPAGLRVVPDLDAALADAEAEVLRRARLLDAADTDDFASFRRDHPEEFLAARVLVVAGCDTDGVVDLVGRSARFGIAAVVIDGEAPAVIESDPDGNVSAASFSPLSDTSGARVFQLEEVDARAVLSALEDPGHPPESPEEPFIAPRALKDGAPALSVRLLGPYVVEAAGREVRTGLRSKARELLAYFLVRPEGASLEAAADALFPDSEPGQDSDRFWTALGNLRSTLRRAGGDADLTVVDKVGDLYRVDPECVACDLWRFEDALARARNADDDATTTAALADAAHAYGGELAAGAFYAWVETPREDLRRRAVDALARLADLHQGVGDFDGALAALEQAVEVDPYAEELYRRLMTVQFSLGRPTVRATFQRLESRLAELDVDPDPETVALVESLLARPTHRPDPAALLPERVDAEGRQS